MVVEEIDPIVKTPVRKVKDIEFFNIISISKSNIVYFWIFFWICFSREMVIFTVEIKIFIDQPFFQSLMLKTTTNVPTRKHFKTVVK